MDLDFFRRKNILVKEKNYSFFGETPGQKSVCAGTLPKFKTLAKLLPNETYHFFNHANGFENLFVEKRNYSFFLKRLKKYILPIAKLYAYCLMPNHFHLVGAIRTEEELLKAFKINKQISQNSKILEKLLKKKISKAFANLFSSYAQSFNKVYKRRGSLFVPSMKKKLIEDDDSFCKVVHYVHANPVHHGFVSTMNQWPHSSYNLFFSSDDSIIEKDYVIDLFGGLDEFIKYHLQPVDLRFKTFD